MNLSNVTILITSFLRPGHLADCLVGIKRNLPECRVLVVDDSATEMSVTVPKISLPFDSGLSAKRNRGVAAVSSEFLLMGSDDFDFSTVEARRGIEKLLLVLESNPEVHVAGGHVDGNVYEGDLVVAPGQYIAQTKLQITSNVTPCDLVVNYFLARTEAIRPYPWDERMKIGGEHGDWFLTLKDNGLKVVAVSDVNITTLPYNRSKEDPRYASFRGRAKSLGHRIFLRKRGVSEFYGSESVPPPALKLPRFMVAVVACHKFQNRVDELRKTWLPSMYKVDYKVFYGSGANRDPLPDEVFLDVPDDYLSLPTKMKAIYQWVLSQGYEYVLKVDDDTFVEVPRMVTSGFQHHDYTGRPNHGGAIPWASGAAYWLSKRAMQIVANAPLTSDTAEDRWVATTLQKQNILVNRDMRYDLIIYSQPNWNIAITACICHPNVTMQMIADAFEGGGSAAMDQVLPPLSSSNPKGITHAPYSAPNPNWNETFLDKKVKALFQRFKFVTATVPGSSHYKSLCKIYPEHMEEMVDTPEGKRTIFIVSK